MTPTRAYRWVGARWVHYRVAGKGPLVVLLHGSPQSGAAVAGVMAEIVANGCTALALDTPGNGCSDALPGAPEDVRDYAHALAETLDSLGVARAAFYGFHTGAAHAAAFAGLFPQRVSALALDGFPIWTEAERADLLAQYLPPFVPRWDGAHLTWAWARMEAQSIFFPWYAHRDDARMPRHAVPAPEQMHENVLDLLRAGDSYRAPYASAFRCNGRALLAQVTAPTLLCAGARDPLAVHLDRLPSPPPHIAVRRHDFERPAAWADIARWLATRAIDAAPDWPEPGADSAGVTRHVICGTRIYAFGAGRDRPRALMHDRGESVDAALRSVRSPASTGPLLLLERAWHGESAGDGAPPVVLRALGCPDAALEIADCATPPPVAPRWDGSHLQTAWRYAWRRTLFEPWDAPEAEHARTGALDVGAIHARAIDLLKAWRALAER